MAPQYFEVEVWYNDRELRDQRMRVVIDWHPDHAERTERLLNGVIEQVAETNRARASSNPAAYVLHAYPVDERGERREPLAWLWYWHGLREEGQRR